MGTRASHKYAAPRHKQAPSDFLLYAVHPSTDSPSVHVAHCDHRLLTPSPPSRGKGWWCKSLVHPNDSPSLALCHAQGCSAGLSSAAQPSPLLRDISSSGLGSSSQEEQMDSDGDKSAPGCSRGKSWRDTSPLARGRGAWGRQKW